MAQTTRSLGRESKPSQLPPKASGALKEPRGKTQPFLHLIQVENWGVFPISSSLKAYNLTMKDQKEKLRKRSHIPLHLKE